jgi:hypothetical protein
MGATIRKFSQKWEAKEGAVASRCDYGVFAGAELVLSKSAQPHFAVKCDERQDGQHKRSFRKYGTQSR